MVGEKIESFKKALMNLATSRVPNTEDMRSQIQNLMRTTHLNVYSPACLISASWMKRWRDSVGFETSPPTRINVGEINNEDLIIDGQVRMNAREGIDYEILTEAVYNQLHSWYGGGPKIKCNVEYNSIYDKCEVIIHTPIFEIYFQGRKKPFEFSLFRPIEILKKEACEFFKVSENRTRLCDYPLKIRQTELDCSNILAYYSFGTSNINQKSKVIDNDDDDRIIKNKKSYPKENNFDDKLFVLNSNKNSGHSSKNNPNSNNWAYSLLPEEMNDDGSWPIISKSKDRNYWKIMDPCSPGLHGIENINNTCYLSSALQCLVHTKLLVDYFNNNAQIWKDDIILDNPNGTKGQLVEAFADIMNLLWTEGIPSVSPRFVKGVIGEFAPQFATSIQQDAHELLTILLDKLHEDLNNMNKELTEPIFDSVPGVFLKNNNHFIKRPRIHSNSGNTNFRQSVTHEMAWNTYLSQNDSIITKNIYGMYKINLTCPNCRQCNTIYDPFSSLSLPLPIQEQRTRPFLFVPWDVKSPRVRMQLKLPNPNSIEDVTKAISMKLNRPMQIIFAEHSHNSIDLKWITDLTPTSQDHKMIVFELPTNYVTNNTSLFAQVRALSTIVCCGHIMQKEIDAFYLVELPSDDPTDEEIQTTCEERFAPMFTPTCGDITSNHARYILNHLASSLTLLEDESNQRRNIPDIVTKVAARSYETKVAFERDPNINIATRRRIDAKFNPEAMKDKTKFDWSSFGNVINTIESVSNSPLPNSFSLRECLELLDE
ncbi:hypothetical protein TRFO_11667 [Tritrichomonas foetus]|uniref:ubiquitinyl hydrolase 1 n=1 Tax=Tritrichomonas foetus TaxID=1144522 RepID=A0A1J4J677_9EUKA|nr:hypothetical protein TRFO_11667 [Tritrichomonas foetus]|eukprot:OHS93663.1 hypothetical protein TRFO_11667 [Tritrichomonas foetus]